MIVTELREALQKLEAEGKGGLPVAVREIVDFDNVWAYSSPDPLRELVVETDLSSSSIPPGAIVIALEVA